MYTDSSKADQGVGFAAVSTKTYQFSFPEKASVFVAELMAIFYKLRIVGRKAYKSVIYSDFRSALDALKSYAHPHTLGKKLKVTFSALYAKGFKKQETYLEVLLCHYNK